MRKNHHGKKDRLVKRVFALCLALAVICTCLVPVFATEYKDVVDSGEEEIAGFGGDEAAGFGGDFPAVDDGEPREVYDDSEAAGFGEEEASRPVEGGEDNLDGGPSVKETEWGTVIENGPSSSTGTDPEPETQWSGEDDVVEKPDDKVVVSGDEIKKLQDMVVYRFWLRELNTLDLQDITAQAQINNMTESEYLARNGGTCTLFRLCPGQRPLRTTAATSRTPPPTGTPRANCGCLTTGTRWTSLATGCA